MSGIKSALVLAFLLTVIFVNSQNSSLPAVEVYSLDGERIKASDISNEGKVMIIVFWKTYSKDGSNQVLMLSEVQQEWIHAEKVKFVAICCDCVGTTSHVKPIVYGQDIDMDVFVDKNGDLMRAMNIHQTPYTMMLDNEMNVHCKYIGYCANGDEMVCKKLEECMTSLD